MVDVVSWTGAGVILVLEGTDTARIVGVELTTDLKLSLTRRILAEAARTSMMEGYRRRMATRTVPSTARPPPTARYSQGATL